MQTPNPELSVRGDTRLTEPQRRRKARKPRFPLRVVKGGYTPADSSAALGLRSIGHRVGDLVFCEFSKPRNPKFNRLVHKFGDLLSQNLDTFDGLDAHQVLKRLQLEGDIGCDKIGLIFPDVGPCEYRIPRSLSFESMDEGEFYSIYRQFSQYVHTKYWQEMSPEQIERMAEMMPDPV